MSSFDSHNHTPLDFHRLKNHYLQPSGRQGIKLPSNSPNIFLISTVVIFVLSISYSVNVSQTKQTTQASKPAPTADAGQLPGHIAELNIDPAIQAIKEYPTTYNQQSIPPSIYTAAQAKYSQARNQAAVKRYIIDRVMKYYMYTNILAENSVVTAPEGDPTFQTIESRVPQLEKQVKEELVTSMDFAYIFAWFNSPRLQEIRGKLGDSLEPIARKQLEMYQKEFNAPNANAKAIIDRANRNKDLSLLNENDRYGIVEDYTQDYDFISGLNFPPTKTNFNDFLFNLDEGQASELYKIDNGPGKKLYLLIYPITLEEKNYPSLKDIYLTKIPLFTFK